MQAACAILRRLVGSHTTLPSDCATRIYKNLSDLKSCRDEWALLESWLTSLWATFAQGARSPDKFASLVWHHVFRSKSWFHLIDRLALVASWLASGNNDLMDMAVNYLRFHQRTDFRHSQRPLRIPGATMAADKGDIGTLPTYFRSDPGGCRPIRHSCCPSASGTAYRAERLLDCGYCFDSQPCPYYQ